MNTHSGTAVLLDRHDAGTTRIAGSLKMHDSPTRFDVPFVVSGRRDRQPWNPAASGPSSGFVRK